MRSLYHYQYRTDKINSENSYILFQTGLPTKSYRVFIGPCAAFPLHNPAC